MTCGGNELLPGEDYGNLERANEALRGEVQAGQHC